MAHHWSPMRELIPSVRPGEWLMTDEGRRIGYIQAARSDGREVYRCQTAEHDPAQRIVLGQARTLRDAANRLWDWGRRTPSGWRPAHDLVEIAPDVWALPPRPGHKFPQGVITRQTRGNEERFEAISGGTANDGRARIGHFGTLDAAAKAVWEFPAKG